MRRKCARLLGASSGSRVATAMLGECKLENRWALWGTLPDPGIGHATGTRSEAQVRVTRRTPVGLLPVRARSGRVVPRPHRSAARTARRGRPATRRWSSLRRSRWRRRGLAAARPGPRLRAWHPGPGTDLRTLRAGSWCAWTRGSSLPDSRAPASRPAWSGLYGIGPMPRLRSAGTSSISTARTARLYRLCSEVRPRKCRLLAADWARAMSQAAKLLLPT